MKNQGISRRQVLMFIGLVVLVLLFRDLRNRMTELNRLNEQQKVVAEQSTALKSTEVELVTQIAYATSDDAVEDWARTNRQAQEGDVAIVPLAPAESTPVPTPMPVDTPEPVNNWELWLALFVDSEP